MRGEFRNTFEKGLNSDFNIVYQPKGTYRYMKNCSLISQDGNNYVIKDCLGNTRIFTINPPYEDVYTDVGQLPMPIGFISFPNKIIVLSTNNEDENGGYGEIGEINYLPYGEGIQPDSVVGQYNPGYVPLYHSIDLDFSKLHRIEGFGYEENELVARIYWTDNFNEPRVFNVSDPIFKNYIATGDLVVGQDYMVLEGAITHDGVDYGPGLTDGNIFTAATAAYINLTGISPTPKIVVYYPFELLNFTPSRSLGTISFVEYGNGNLYGGNKMYFYRLGKAGVPISSWSYGSSMIHVGDQNDADFLISNNYHDFVGDGTGTVLARTPLSVFVKITNVDTNFDFIDLACAEFDQSATVPRLISIVARETIAGSEITIEHTGNSNLGNLTLADITLFPASILKIKTLATNKNFILAGNITERAEFDIDFSNATANDLEYPMNVHMDADSCSLSGYAYTGVSPVCGANPAAGTVTPFSRYLVTQGTAIYNGNNYTAGMVITGITGAGNDSIDTTTNPATQVRPCVTRCNYTTMVGAIRRENAIEITGNKNVGFWDYKEPTVHHHVKGYWRGEKYRFGILFFDKKGNPFYVKHLLDHKFARGEDDGLLRSDVIGNTGNLVYSLKPRIISFGNIEIPLDIINEISGFSIVRAERDARIITQGLVTQCTDTGATPKLYEVGAWIPSSNSLNTVADKVYVYLSPDLLVDSELPGSVGVVGDTIESASWNDAYDYGSGVRVRGSGPAASEFIYSKMLTPANSDDEVKSSTITFWGDVSEGETLNMLGADSLSNVINTTASAIDINGDCVTGGVDYQFNSQHDATGCKKVIFTLEDDFTAYNVSDLFTSVAGSATTQKPLMNYVKTGFSESDAYGGNGEDALANTLYISTGHFQPITQQVILDTLIGDTCYFFDVEVAGGDCFVNLIDIGYGLWNNDFTNKYSYAWTFPCECNSNYNLRRGRKTSNVGMYYTGDPSTVDMVYKGPANEIRLEDYSYNPGYTSGTELVHYPATPLNFINANEFKARIRYAGEKFIGEIDDSFRTFAQLDFKDLSVQNGRINNIKVKEDKVIVWQDLAVNSVPILERQILSGLDGAPTTLGTGGVVDRFDVLTSYFGNQHQWSVVETEYGFVWFDMHRKGMVALGFDGTGIAEISLVNSEQGFFNEAVLEAIGVNVDPDILLNSPTFADTSDRPLVGVGITGGFDPKFKMVHMTFKFKAEAETGIKTVDFTISYLHTRLDKFFISFHDWVPAIYHTHNQWMLAANDPKNITQFLSTNIFNKSFVVGETLRGVSFSGAYSNTEYICVANVTLDNADKYPLGVSGDTYWQPVNNTNDIWFWNQPTVLNQLVAGDYQYNKAFGKVFDNQVDIVINPPLSGQDSMEVQNISQIGPYNVNYTDIYIDADNQTAQDLNIPTTSIFYRFIRDRITFVPPLPTAYGANGGRITNKYLRVKLIKHNWLTDPRVVTTSVKILRELFSIFNTKK